MGRGGFEITIEVKSEEVMAGLRAQRRAIGQDIKRLTGSAAKDQVLPYTKAIAPSITRGNLDSRSTTRGAYLTVKGRGQRRAIAALLNFGGTIRTPIVPKRKKALHWGNVYTAKVTAPRKIAGKHFLERSVRVRLPAFADQVERELARIMRSRITAAGTF